MLIWVLAAVLTIICCVALFYSGRRGAVNGGDTEALTARIGVYKAQVAEIERDEVVGTISSFEAHSARAELARELLRQAEASDKGNKVSDTGNNVTDKGALGAGNSDGDAGLPDGDSGQTGAQARFGLPALALALFATIAMGATSYALLGQPTRGDQQLAQRTDVAAALELADAIAKVEERLTREPDDVRGWQVIAPIYLGQQRFEEAVNAYERVVELAGPDADNQTNLAEALGAAAGGIFTPKALELLRAAAVSDPDHIRSRFYLAAHATENGDYEAALGLWTATIDLAVPGAPWLATARQGQALAMSELAASGVNAGAGEAAATDPPAGPDPSDIAAASELSASDRSAMVAEMVLRLAGRLEADGGTSAEWAQLVRSRTVLGQLVEAREDLASARQALKGPMEGTRFEEMIADLKPLLEPDETGALQ